jgi:hypothetical protein
MNILADGDFTADVSGTDRRDEVGIMAKAVQVQGQWPGRVPLPRNQTP